MIMATVTAVRRNTPRTPEICRTHPLYQPLGQAIRHAHPKSAGHGVEPVYPYAPGVILIAFVGHADSHAMQSMQSLSRIGSDLSVRHWSHSAPDFPTTLSLPVPLLPRFSCHLNTAT